MSPTSSEGQKKGSTSGVVHLKQGSCQACRIAKVKCRRIDPTTQQVQISYPSGSGGAGGRYSDSNGGVHAYGGAYGGGNGSTAMRSNVDERCQRCVELGDNCVYQEYRVGRRKGSKNKRRRTTGAEVSISISSSLPPESRFIPLDNTSPAPAYHPNDNRNHTLNPNPHRISPYNPKNSNPNPNTSPNNDDSYVFWTGSTETTVGPLPILTNDRLLTEDNVNPLGLVASASCGGDVDIDPIPNMGMNMNVPRQAQPVTLPVARATHQYFGLPRSKLDIEVDKDPIELGLITLAEADMFFDYFHTHLVNIRWGLDPQLCTVEYTRKRSSLLFTSILASSAKFMDTQESASTRLGIHLRNLLVQIIRFGYKSVDIVTAFLVIIPWISPGEHVSDDPTTQYAALAVNMALDLHMDKPVDCRPGYGVLEVIDVHGGGGNASYAGISLSPEQVCAIDGLREVELGKEMLGRLFRSRQRIWLALFILDRGVGLARGRPCLMPVGSSIASCDTWHLNPDAAPGDAVIAAVVALRRDLGPMLESVRFLRVGHSIVSSENQMKALVDEFFHSWHSRWGPLLRQVSPVEGDSPPYVHVLVNHTRLSVYTSLLGRGEYGLETSLKLCAAALDAAYTVMRAAVRYEPYLRAIPNNTCVMIAFAACTVIGISSKDTIAHLDFLRPEDLNLVERTLEVLDRLGSRPAHRRGAGSVYSAHLRGVLQLAHTQNTAPPECGGLSGTGAGGWSGILQQGFGATTGRGGVGVGVGAGVAAPVGGKGGGGGGGSFDLGVGDWLDWLAWPVSPLSCGRHVAEYR